MVNITNPTGQSVGQAGQAVTQVGGVLGDQKIVDLAHVSQQQYQANVLDAAKVASQAQLDWTQQLQQRQQSATGNGAGLTEGFLKDFDQYSNDTISNYNDPVTRNLLQHEFTQMRTGFGTKMLGYQQNLNENYQIQNTNQFVSNNAAILAQDSTQYDVMKAKTVAVINNSPLDPVQKQRAIDDALKTYRYSAANNLLMNNPVQGLGLLKTATGQIQPGSTEEAIVKASGSHAMYNLAVMGVESSYNPSAESSASSASGLAGMTDSVKKQYGLPESATVEQQVTALNKLTEDNRKQLSHNLGRSPSYNELYLAHHFGATGATKILSADPNEPISNVVSADAMAANPYLKGKTVQQVKDINASKFNGYSLVSDFQAEERVQYTNRFQSAVDTVAETKKVNLESTIKDQLAMAADGNTSFTPLTQEQFQAMYPKDNNMAVDKYTQYTKAISLGQALNEVNNITPEQEMQKLQELAPNESKGYAGDRARQADYISAIQAKHKQIQDDPASWAMSHSSTVQAAFNKANGTYDPASKAALLNQAYTTLYAEQQRQGVAYPKIINKGQEAAMITQLQNTKGMQKSQLLTQMSEQYGSYWGTVAGQLQTNPNMPEGMSAMMSAPTLAAKERAANLADVPFKTLSEALPSNKDKKKLDTSIDSALDNFKASFPAYALQGKNVTDVMENVRKAAYDNARTMSENTAAETAVDQFVGQDKYNYVEQSGADFTVRLPKSYDSDTVASNLKNQMNSLTINDVYTGNAKLYHSVWTMQDDVSGYLGHVKDHGYWMTNQNETGANLFFIGNNNIPYPVLDKSGKQITKTFQELNIPRK